MTASDFYVVIQVCGGHTITFGPNEPRTLLQLNTRILTEVTPYLESFELLFWGSHGNKPVCPPSSPFKCTDSLEDGFGIHSGTVLCLNHQGTALPKEQRPIHLMNQGCRLETNGNDGNTLTLFPNSKIHHATGCDCDEAKQLRDPHRPYGLVLTNRRVSFKVTIPRGAIFFDTFNDNILNGIGIWQNGKRNPTPTYNYWDHNVYIINGQAPLPYGEYALWINRSHFTNDPLWMTINHKPYTLQYSLPFQIAPATQSGYWKHISNEQRLFSFLIEDLWKLMLSFLVAG